MKATVVGGGLAGSEAAWALAERDIQVTLYEMRPGVRTPAHHTDRLAELVCSNSFKSIELTNAHGLLKAELRAPMGHRPTRHKRSASRLGGGTGSGGGLGRARQRGVYRWSGAAGGRPL